MTLKLFSEREREGEKYVDLIREDGSIVLVLRTPDGEIDYYIATIDEGGMALDGLIGDDAPFALGKYGTIAVRYA